MEMCYNNDSTMTDRRLAEVRNHFCILEEYELHVPLHGQRPYDAFSDSFVLSIDALEAWLRFSLHPLVRTESLLETVGIESPLELVGTESSFELFRVESPLKLVRAESPLETIRTESPLESIEAESPLELIGTESPLEMLGTESLLELVEVKTLLEMVGTESLLELISARAHWRWSKSAKRCLGLSKSLARKGGSCEFFVQGSGPDRLQGSKGLDGHAVQSHLALEASLSQPTLSPPAKVPIEAARERPTQWGEKHPSEGGNELPKKAAPEGTSERANRGKGKELVKVVESPDQPPIERELCKVDDRGGKDRYFIARFLSYRSQVWTDGSLAIEYMRVALHPSLTKQLYEASSKALMDRAAKSAVWVSKNKKLKLDVSLEAVAAVKRQATELSVEVERLKAALGESKQRCKIHEPIANSTHGKLKDLWESWHQLEDEVLSLTRDVEVMWSKQKTEGDKVIVDYKGSQGF
ncbi:hypothetical protein BHE74_00049130 [Ensete ventricosum]|nr:hypothetical protein BHE74_00049130 [Ensete ventricosum]